MLILIVGIIVFLGAHSFSTLRSARDGLIARVGAGPYKGLHSLISLVGFGLIVWGFGQYRASGLIPIWTPPTWARHVTIPLMWLAFVALGAMGPTPGLIRGLLRHPMLVAIKIWALAHLLVNGDAGGMVLFGAFLAWAVWDRISVKRRGDLGAPRHPGLGMGDAIALGVGTLAYVGMVIGHRWLIGVSVIGG
jgi:uncharacterized membrane protein